MNKKILNIILSMGFLSLCVSTFIAHQNPASSYEISIYKGTPSIVWGGVCLALLLSIIVSIFHDEKTTLDIGIGLGLSSITVIVALPIIRGYHYVGEGDSLTHLGYTRNISTGAQSITDITYPAVHTIGSIISKVTYIDLPHSLLITMIVFILLFVFFIPLLIRIISSNLESILIGTFSGFLLLPVNHIAVHMTIHTTSQAIMFAPVVLYLFITSMVRNKDSYIVLFLITSAMYTLLHIQQAANFLLLFGSIAVLQAFFNKINLSDNVVKWDDTFDFRIVYIFVTIFGLMFWVWVMDSSSFYGNLVGFIVALLTETQAAESVATRTGSLGAVGGTIGEVFFKMFLIPLIYCLLAGLLMMISFLAILVDINPSFERILPNSILGKKVVFYMSSGFIPIMCLFAAYLIGGISDQYFRHYGFMMVIVTIIGSISLGNIIHNTRSRSNQDSKYIFVAFLFIIFCFSLPVMFSSPYIYQDSDHVSESQMNGYDTIFQYEDGHSLFDFVRSPAPMYRNAVQGVPSDDWRHNDRFPREGVPDHFADQNLDSHYDNSVYIPVTAADRMRETELFNGFRFDSSDFEYLDSNEDINKVYSNEGVDLYRIE